MQTRDIQQEEWRKPTPKDGETILFDEPGRVLDLKAEGGKYNVDYRSHSFRVFASEVGSITLAVKHGGGQERWHVGSENAPLLHALARLSSDERYFTLYAIMEAHTRSAQMGYARACGEYESAFIEGRLKKRKERGKNQVRVWIERRPATDLRNRPGESKGVSP